MKAARQFLSGDKRRRLANDFLSFAESLRLFTERKRNFTFAARIEIRDQNQGAFVRRRGDVGRAAVKVHVQSLRVIWRKLREFDRNFAPGNSRGGLDSFNLCEAAHLL